MFYQLNGQGKTPLEATTQRVWVLIQGDSIQPNL